jgi:hypothetical protein
MEFARSINPKIELVDRGGEFGVAIGADVSPTSSKPVFVGSNGWDASVSLDHPQTVHASRNPFGPGAAACLSVGEVFRQVFDLNDPPASSYTMSTLDLALEPTANNISIDDVDVQSAVLVGVGAIGNAAVWALGNAPIGGLVHLVDAQRTELSNLQRYILCNRTDEGRSKVRLARQFLSNGIRGVAHEQEWTHFVANGRRRWSHVLVALDSAQARRDVQSSLPEWIANAWTQPGDLGVSVHPWSEEGACLACLYLPTEVVPGEDRVIGSAIGLTSDIELLQIRRLLHTNSPLPAELYQQVSSFIGVPPEDLARFADRPLRELYVEGLCGGAVLPLSRVGHPSQEVHVPIAHQSALAGVLLAGRLVAKAIGRSPDSTQVTRVDVLRGPARYLSQPAQKDARGICICQDQIYRAVFNKKYTQRGT